MTFVIGALGLVGSAFLRALRAEVPDTLGTHHQEVGTLKKFNLLQPDLGKLMEGGGYSSAIVAAGIPSILRCEKEPTYTYQCNVKGTLELVEQLCKKGIIPILFSTDYVFDGIRGGYDEESPTSPLNEYGKQKAVLEKQIVKEFPDICLLIRLSKVYGTLKGDKTLMDEMASSIVNGKKVRAAYDQVFCPIHIDDVVDCVRRLVSIGARGIYNVSGEEAISRLDLARSICRELGASLDLVESISLQDLSEPFIRPRRTDMTNRKVCEKTGIKMRSLKSSIKTIVDQYRN
ncbi:MAG TPA: sugar nucleotide-binding protein [Chlamydiales bacterium]|nr:sugar nucleotide-binding protein [Chlamydiales bacterium]